MIDALRAAVKCILGSTLNPYGGVYNCMKEELVVIADGSLMASGQTVLPLSDSVLTGLQFGSTFCAKRERESLITLAARNTDRLSMALHTALVELMSQDQVSYLEQVHNSPTPCLTAEDKATFSTNILLATHDLYSTQATASIVWRNDQDDFRKYKRWELTVRQFILLATGGVLLSKNDISHELHGVGGFYLNDVLRTAPSALSQLGLSGSTPTFDNLMKIIADTTPTNRSRFHISIKRAITYCSTYIKQHAEHIQISFRTNRTEDLIGLAAVFTSRIGGLSASLEATLTERRLARDACFSSHRRLDVRIATAMLAAKSNEDGRYFFSTTSRRFQTLVIAEALLHRAGVGGAVAQALVVKLTQPEGVTHGTEGEMRCDIPGCNSKKRAANGAPLQAARAKFARLYTLNEDGSILAPARLPSGSDIVWVCGSNVTQSRLNDTCFSANVRIYSDSFFTGHERTKIVRRCGAHAGGRLGLLPGQTESDQRGVFNMSAASDHLFKLGDTFKPVSTPRP
jgi:hypothetical protein